jgi:CubicO group peptidase (beta-lactamase class C family)
MPVTTNNAATENRTALPRATPEAEGIASTAIAAFLDAAAEKNLELHSLMLLRRGNVLAEGWWSPYTPTRRHMLYSLSKSFLSTAAGLAIAEGRFGLDDRVADFFPDEVPTAISENLARMTVRHLLSMATGHQDDKTGVLRNDPDGSWVRAFLGEAVEHEPGTFFRYNSAATYMVSAILQKTTGVTALEYLQARLLGPLGITGATWETDPRGISVGGWGLSIRTEEIARFGELYRCRGVWDGQTIVPADWVERATSAQVSNGDPDTDSDWQQGYGFQFWRCRNGAYRADGAFGQFCVVMPEQEAVFVTTANVDDLQAVLDLLWEILLPAMGSGTAPLPDDGAAQQALRNRLAALRLTAPSGEKASPTAARVNGRTYRFPPSEQGIRAVTPYFTDDAVTLRIEDDAGTHTVAAGLAEWKTGTTTFLRQNITRSLPAREGRDAAGQEDPPAAAGAAWTSDDTLAVRLCLIETPFTPTISLTFSPDGTVRFGLRGRVGFGPSDRPVLEGIAA